MQKKANKPTRPKSAPRSARPNGTASSPLLNWRDERARSITPPQKNLPTVGLFAGVGGIELGLKSAGHETTLLCENDVGASAVLRTRFKDAEHRTDVRELRSLPKETQLLTAGFPCQDLSQAGMTVGITGDRSGLVGEVFRLLRRKRVPWVLLENVPFMLQLSKGQALEVIIRELEDMGYRWAYRVVNAQAFGLPQRRERVFLLASREHDPRDVLLAEDAGRPTIEQNAAEVACGFYWTEGVRGLGWAVDAVPTLKGGSTVGIPSPPAICMPGGRIIKPDLRDAERLQGFRVDWTKPAEQEVRRSFRWRLVGNAVCVPVAKWIGKSLTNPKGYDGTWDKVLPEGARWPRAAWSLGKGKGRFTAECSAWPRHPRRPPSLVDFLTYEGDPLSLRASSGFRSRTRTGSLRFPPGFLDAMDAHIERMRQSAGDGVRNQPDALPAPPA